MIRILCFIAGLTGAAGLSQFPEFSQQYLQRLGGHVDALTSQLVDFDTVALDAGYGREAMLQQMALTPPVDTQAAMWRRTILRHAQMSDDLASLRDASPVARLLMPHRVTDADIARAVWADFQPAVPLTVAGVMAGGAGFVLGWLALALLALPFAVAPRAARTAKPVAAVRRAAPVVKGEPPIAKPQLVVETPSHIPRLSGVKR